MEKTVTINKDCEEIGVDLVINDDFLCDIVENILNNGSLDDKFICDMIEEMDEILNGANT